MPTPQHYVICKYCGIKFNRDVEPTVKIGERRYAHKACAEKVEAAIPQEEKDYMALEQYIKKLFKIDTVSMKIKKQIRDFKAEYGYSYTGILKTLYWWYEIKEHTLEQSNDGIGIVPYVYNDAEHYFYTLYLAQLVNNNINPHTNKIEEVEIASPRVRTNPIKLFDLKK